MDSDGDNLKYLIERRNELIREREKLLRCREKANTPTTTLVKIDTTKRHSISSCSVVECSDEELEIQRHLLTTGRKQSVVVNTSTDDEFISTSTIRLHKDHPYFTGRNSTAENKLKSPEIDHNDNKVKILSDIPVSVEIDKENNIFITSKTEDTLKCSISLANQLSVSQKIEKQNNDQQIDGNNEGTLNLDMDQQLESPPINFQSETDKDATDCSSPVIKIPSPSTFDLRKNNTQMPCTSNEAHCSYVQTGRKRKRKQNFQISCLDFMSENEGPMSNADFSSGSSDNWENNESDAGTSSDEENLRKMKRQKIDSNNKLDISLIKKNRRINKRKERKNLKDKGLAYETVKGVTKNARSLKDNPCVVGKCPRKCYEISQERRQAIFDYFWKLDNQRKRDWIIFNSKASIVKRKKTKQEQSRRARTHQYSINEGEGRRMVCQQFLLKTLDISQKLLLYTLSNENKHGLAKVDERKPNVQPKYDDETKQSAKNFFENLPAVPSHYCRQSSKRLYLAQELKNVTNLHSIYKKERTGENKPFLSERLFINMFHEDYNYSFHTPKKDKCQTCTKYENNPDDVSAEKLAEHMKDKTDMEKRFKYHQELRVPGNKTLVASFDLQKVLNTPYGESMLLYYSRKYAVYNFTVYESATQNGYCYVWGESDGKRGSNEIGSCLYKYLMEVDKRKVEHLILYCDSCAGQNKNKTILALFRHFLTTSINLQTIQINYLLPGHTYMPVDSMHATIEREVRKLTVWAPSQWPSFIESARKNPRPYCVEVMEHSDFLDFEGITESTFPPEVLKNINLRIRQVKIVTFKKKKADSIAVKYSMSAKCQTVIMDLKATPSTKPPKGKGKANKSAKNTKNSEELELKDTRSRGQSKKGKGVGKKTVQITKKEIKAEQISKTNRKESQKGKGKGKKTKNMNENEDAEYNLSLNSEKAGEILKPLYKQKLEIAAQKFKDLKRLCDNGTIPKRYHKEYLTLPHSKKIKATLAETDEEDESSDEN